jgi:RimJ/RimL family protein N-acetyltransferase
MEIIYQDICIRKADSRDAEQLCKWWNDGSIMAHAGFPLGLGTTVEKIIEQLSDSSSEKYRHMILYKQIPIGEMMYGDLGNHICEIGIKICNDTMQNKGLGKKILSLFLHELFESLHFEKV